MLCVINWFIVLACPMGEPLGHRGCGVGAGPCPRGYFCNRHPTEDYSVCCEIRESQLMK